MINLRPVRVEDAEAIFPLLDHTPVTETLAWDGPRSLEELRDGYAARAERTARGESFSFTVVEAAGGRPIGSASLRPDPDRRQASLGLWIGVPYQGRSHGTHVIRWLVVYGFEQLGLEKMAAAVFVGNQASRRAHEKHGFQVEETRLQALTKGGRRIDEWQLGLARSAYLENEQRLIVHLTSAAEWVTARQSGAYRAPSLDAEGFVHLSRPSQVLQVANHFYRSLEQAVLLWVDPQQVQAELRWEAAGEQVFPHLYGPLPTQAVLSAPYMPRTPGGEYMGAPKA